MQGRLCLSRIIQFSSGAFVMNTRLILFSSMLQVALKFAVGLLMKKL